MGKVFARIAFYSFFILFLLAGKPAGRDLQHDAAESVSDGVSDGGAAGQNETFLHLKETYEEQCQPMYGFLPCSSNLPSNLVLVLIYIHLLRLGESFAGDDERITRVFGKNFYAAMLSQLLDSLIESLILLVTGLMASKEKAEVCLETGFGLLAGSSIFLVTDLWGMCFIFARRPTTDYYVKPGHQVTNHQKNLLHGSGVVIDAKTNTDARIMLLSLIPFLVVLLPSLFGLASSSEVYKIVFPVSLCVSVICLFSYFYYQNSHPRIWEIGLEYEEAAQKVQMHVPFYEVQAVLLNRERYLMIKQKEMEKLLRHPDSTIEKTMTREKFYDIFKKWMDETTQLMDDPHSIDQLGTQYNQVAELLFEDKNQLIDVISMLLKHTSGEELCIEDEASIDRFFQRIDADDDKYITRSELKQFIMEGNCNNVLIDDKIVEIFMEHIHIDGDENISQQEFKYGITKWLDKINRVASRNQKNQSQDKNQETNEYQRGRANVRAREKRHAVCLLLSGIILLMVLAEPLVENFWQLSESILVRPFYVSFIILPVYTKASMAKILYTAAAMNRHQKSSRAISEIYNKVFMNNILVFFALVSIIYFHGLKWHFSAEILVVVIVCFIMGILTSFRSKLPNWILLIAFLLYPLSLGLIYHLRYM